MKGFLEEVIGYVYERHKSFDKLVFVLPSKRAGLFLKKHITSFLEKPIFSPRIYSIEELVKEISNLDPASNFELLLELYEAFQPFFNTDEESFESFVTWGNTLLSDFNEIDRNLVPHGSLFDYLTATQRLKKWGADERPTPLISNTVRFWGQLKTVYERFQKRLLEKRTGYQGLLYKEAVSKTEKYLSSCSELYYHFIGFNALNKAEEQLFHSFAKNGNSMFWWDIDSSFLEDTVHEAGLFIRNYIKAWPNGQTFTNHTSCFLKEKKIVITGIPKSVSQAKFTGQLLESTLKKDGDEQNVALVLSDETLLKPILNTLPPNASKINITMGLPLNKTSLFDFFNSLFNLHLNPSKNGWFHKQVNKVLSNPYSINLLDTSHGNLAFGLSNYIREKNILFINKDILDRNPFSESHILQDIFSEQATSGKSFARMCQKLIGILKEKYLEINNHLELQYLYAFFQLFNQLESHIASKSYLRSLKAVWPLFNELVSNEQIDFKGEPLGGLQIMGVLESRNLDFETIVITSVNEGILPAGKSQNSFIPYDIKKEFGLPTYKEKDAIYAYHFYRFLQRAKHVHILYNTEPDILQGNERSRFISQLLTDRAIAPYVTHGTAAPHISIEMERPKTISKTPKLSKLLMELAERGFSPSSLTNYIKDPYSFYTNNVLRLNEVEDVEENMAYNTFGTIVHDTLEALYLPIVGKQLTKEDLDGLKAKVESVTETKFGEHYLPRDIKNGHNLIAFHVIQKYVNAVIDMDIVRSKSHEIVVLALEKNLRTVINVPGISYPIFLKGKLDRLEKVDGTLHIFDYKTGNVARSEVEVIALEDSIVDEKRAKAFQLLCYALMEHKEGNSKELLAGIIPIKTLRSGIVLFAQKTSVRGPKNHIIDNELLTRFEGHLANLILEILNPDIPFKEKDLTSL